MRRVSPLERIRLFGRAGLDVVAALARSTPFPGHARLVRRTPGTGLHLLVQQLYSVGVLSLA
ncbi:ABC transporter permease, partial [Pseudomonas aeruginosa]